jgi:hypothetical protein
VWHASNTAAIDDWPVGIRCDDGEAARQIEMHLGDKLTASAEPPSGYAVVTGPRAADHGVRPLGELRHGPQTVLRSRYVGRLAAAAVSHVLALGNSGQPVLRLAFSLIARDGNGILVPSHLLCTPGLEPLLVRAEWQLTDTPELAVEVGDAAMVGTVSWSSERSVVTDKVRLRSIVLADDRLDGPPSRSTLLRVLMASSPPSALPPQAHLDLAARLASELRAVPTSGRDPRSFAALPAQLSAG